MRRKDFREKNQPLVMIIPMIDIMLFLLVFFMISTIYMVQTNNFQVTLPQTEQQIDKKETPPNTVSVTVMVNGDILYDDEKISKSQLAEKIRGTLSADSETVFLLLGDKLTRYEQIVGVLEMMKKSGIRRVSIATETK